MPDRLTLIYIGLGFLAGVVTMIVVAFVLEKRETRRALKHWRGEQ